MLEEKNKALKNKASKEEGWRRRKMND